MSQPNRLLVFLMGPTAAGKTEVAIEMARRLDIEIISVDSAMVYREMDIGTAKPDRTTLKQFPHRLVNICDPIEGYSVQRFVQDAEQAVRSAWSAKRIPLLVGGTMLYFKAFRDGLTKMPGANPSIRAELSDRGNSIGWPAMHRELLRLDPVAASKIDPNNRQRIQRALEVYQISGTPISTFWRNDPGEFLEKRLGCKLLQFSTAASRARIHARIENRLDEMLSSGFVEEVEKLIDKWCLGRDALSMRSVGYRQVMDYLNGDYAYASLRDQILFATRQLAKKQETWLRKWPSLDRTVDIQDVNSVSALVDLVLKKP